MEAIFLGEPVNLKSGLAHLVLHELITQEEMDNILK